MSRLKLLSAALFSLAGTVQASEYGGRLEGFEYPYPVQMHAFRSQGMDLEMAYMDVKPQHPNGRTVVLLHGKNFCAATWEGSIEALTQAGYRVIAADQIGFCKSSKPTRYQYSLEQLARNTEQLLESLKIERYSLMGHSMGGMLATRFALSYPQQVEQLLLVNPIGLEDWHAKGVPYLGVDQWYAQELKTRREKIRNYQQNTYYAGHWKPEYDRWMDMQAGMFEGPDKALVAWNSALTYDMLQTQPVVYELPRLQVPTTLFIGQKDNTAVGKGAAPEALRRQLGDYPRLGREAAERIPNAQLVTFDDLGHSPQIQAPQRFHVALLEALKRD